MPIRKVKRAVYPNKRKHKKIFAILSICLLFSLIASLLIFVYFKYAEEEKDGGGGINIAEGNLYVHFIDVGQGDAIFIENTSANMLIDTGNTTSSSKKAVLDFLDSRQVEKINYLVLTHPDGDHIGGAVSVVEKYDVEKCLIPSYVSNTKLYEQVLSSLEKNEVDIIVAKADSESIALGSANATILAPLSDDYSNENDFSIVVSLTYGSTSFVFAGDMGENSERDFINSYKNGRIRCDVLKVGHHGAKESTSYDLLSLLKPKYAIISCGEDNVHGHPDDDTLYRLESSGVECYRTDISGNITLISNGSIINIIEEK